MKLLASDYDGTIRFRGGISEEDLTAISEFKKAGNYFVIVTGRSLASLVKENEIYKLNCDYIAGDNGGIILDKDLNIVFRKEINPQEAMEIIEYLQEIELENFYVDDGFISGLYKEEEFKEEYSGFKKLPLQEILDGGVFVGIKVKSKDSETSSMVKKQIDNLNLTTAVAYQNKNYVDIVPAGTSKLTAVDFIKEKLNPTEIYTIGDGENDLPMIEGYDGYTLDNASDFVKAAATKTFTTVAQAITHINNK